MTDTNKIAQEFIGGMAAPVDPTSWVAECRRKCANSIRNTNTGLWLEQALRCIERQHEELHERQQDELETISRIELTAERISEDPDVPEMIEFFLGDVWELIDLAKKYTGQVHRQKT